MLALYIVLVSANLIFGLFSQKKKSVLLWGNLLAFCLILFSFFLTLQQRNLPDETGYLSMYKGEITSGIERGFLLLLKLFSSFGVDYYFFRSITIAVILIGIVRFCKKLNVNKNLILSLYMILPFMFDVIQIRNAIAFSIVLFAIPFLKDNKLSSYIVYVFLVIIASTIHVMSICYLAFLFYRFLKPRSFIITLVIVGVASLILKYSGLVYDLLTSIIFSGERTNKLNYYTGDKLNWGFLLYYFVILLFSFVYGVIYKNRKFLDPLQKRNSFFLLKLNMCALLLLPFLVINIDFYRIFRNLLVLNYASFNYVKSRKIVVKNQAVGACALIVLCIGVVANVCVSFSGSNSEIFMMFFN